MTYCSAPPLFGGSAPPLFGGRSLALAISLALSGVPAFAASVNSNDDAGGSVENPATQTDAATTSSAVVADPRTSRAGKSTKRGTVRIERPVRAEATEMTPLPNRTRAAQKAYIDPATGEFTSTPPDGEEQAARLTVPDPALNTSSEGLEVVTHPDGSQSVDLQGRFQSYMRATVEEGGKIKVGHQPNAGSPTESAPSTPNSLKR